MNVINISIHSADTPKVTVVDADADKKQETESKVIENKSSIDAAKSVEISDKKIKEAEISKEKVEIKIDSPPSKIKNTVINVSKITIYII